MKGKYGSWLPLLALLAAVPEATPLFAQDVGWRVGTGLLVDADFTLRSEYGPALVADVLLRPANTVSYFATVGGARSDFDIGPEPYHRNYGLAAVGVRAMTGGDGLRVGASLGIGAHFEDDVNETDTGFRSSARGESLLLPSVEMTMPVGSWIGTVSVRHQLARWINGLLDPGERDIGHRWLFLLSIGR